MVSATNLTLTFIGMKKSIVLIIGKSSIDVEMKMNDDLLDGVEVMGYNN